MSEQELKNLLLRVCRPKGKWVHRHYIAGSGRTVDVVYCIECGEEYSYDAETGVSAEDYNSCPNCGAYMRGEE